MVEGGHKIGAILAKLIEFEDNERESDRDKTSMEML